MYNQYNSNGNCSSGTYNGSAYNNGAYHGSSCNSDRSRSRSEKNYSNCPAKFHLHEMQGSVQTTDGGCGCHSHRFATVSCEPVTLRNGDHAHQVTFRTDTYEGHYHEFSGCTTDAFEICEGHVHYLEGKTSEQANHCHKFKVITHIEDPTEE